MKRTVMILFTAVCLLSSPDVTAKGVCSSGTLSSTIVTHTNKSKDTCKAGVEMRRCCKGKKHVKERQYSSVTLAFLAKLFPVLSKYVTTDDAADEPCMYRLHA